MKLSSEMEGVLSRFRCEVVLICAAAVEGASIPGYVDDEPKDFQAGYRAAKWQYAEMLRGMANGELLGAALQSEGVEQMESKD